MEKFFDINIAILCILGIIDLLIILYILISKGI